jgi:hypothetical protein
MECHGAFITLSTTKSGVTMSKGEVFGFMLYGARVSLNVRFGTWYEYSRGWGVVRLNTSPTLVTLVQRVGGGTIN